MNAHTPPPSSARVSDEELHAFIDEQLPLHAREALVLRLQQQPDAAARLEGWRAQRRLLRDLHADVLDEPVPAAMHDALLRAHRQGAARDRWWRWGGVAASVLMAFALGWGLRGMAPPADGSLQREQAEAAFVHQAGVAHAVFTPEQRHPVEVGAGEQAHLAQWLSKRLGKPLKPPVLSAQGYELLGGRLLPGADGARAQFMYQHADGHRLTLYVGALDTGKNSGETAFRFTDEGPVPGFYWVDQGFGYALSGALPRDALAALATAVYRQL